MSFLGEGLYDGKDDGYSDGDGDDGCDGGGGDCGYFDGIATTKPYCPTIHRGQKFRNRGQNRGQYFQK